MVVVVVGPETPSPFHFLSTHTNEIMVLCVSESFVIAVATASVCWGGLWWFLRAAVM